MSAIVYEEVALAEMIYEDSDQMYYYECPCGDKFEISLEDLYDGEDIAPCPSCTLQIKVIFKEVCIRVCVCLFVWLNVLSWRILRSAEGQDSRLCLNCPLVWRSAVNLRLLRPTSHLPPTRRRCKCTGVFVETQQPHYM